jgi:hypothetical protein
VLNAALDMFVRRDGMTTWMALLFHTPQWPRRSNRRQAVLLEAFLLLF